MLCAFEWGTGESNLSQGVMLRESGKFFPVEIKNRCLLSVSFSDEAGPSRWAASFLWILTVQPLGKDDNMDDHVYVVILEKRKHPPLHSALEGVLV